MTDLGKTLKHKKNHAVQSYVPQIFNLGLAAAREAIGQLLKRRPHIQIIDDFEEQLRELYAVNHPLAYFKKKFESELQDHLKSLEEHKPLWMLGRWIYFPWLDSLVHLLPDCDFQKLRTARNRNLITEAEQSRFYNATIGIAGLSVGNSVALAVVLQGGAWHIRLADYDKLALSNLNRIRSGVQHLGLPKAVLTARQIYEINPYAQVEIFPEGLNQTNLKKFFRQSPPLDIVVDEMDSMLMKLLLRMEAKKFRLPVVMAADNGENVIIDVERYDLKPQPRFFHNRLGNITARDLRGLNKFATGQLITKMLGVENIAPRMLLSLKEMGKTLVSWPQLGGSALLNGSAVAYCIKRIVNKQPLLKNRSLVSLDEKLNPVYFTKKQKKERLQTVREFKKITKLDL